MNAIAPLRTLITPIGRPSRMLTSVVNLSWRPLRGEFDRSVGLMRTVTEPRPAASQLGSQDAM